MPQPDPVWLAKLRAEISAVTGHPMIMQRRAEARHGEFIANSEQVAAALRGPATPDHVIWTGPFPQIGRDVAEHVEKYEEYFSQHASRRDVDLIQLDGAARVILDAEL